jgi:hypothetical protein
VATAILVALGCAISAAGGAVIYGTLVRWPWLVDPAESDWAVYSQALFKKLFGPTGLLLVTYAQGIALAVAGAALVGIALAR